MKTKTLLKGFTLHVTNLKYMKLSLFETFSPYSIFFYLYTLNVDLGSGTVLWHKLSLFHFCHAARLRRCICCSLHSGKKLQSILEISSSLYGVLHVPQTNHTCVLWGSEWLWKSVILSLFKLWGGNRIFRNVKKKKLQITNIHCKLT